MASLTPQNLTRDYIDNFSMKKMAQENIVPKYFPDEDVSNLNIGMIGYAGELISNATEDTFNVTSSLYEEQFPNRAKLPASIYSHAAVFQLADGVATASSCTFLLLLNEKHIIENAEIKNGVYYFYIDKNTRILVEDIVFSLDYDIEIRAVRRESLNGYAFSAQYVIQPFTNAISSITNPYIKLRRSADGYISLQVEAHQCIRQVEYDSIINNTKINFPVITIEFEGQLAGFDIFYKSPTDSDYNVQMEKLVEYTAPLKVPFCYYRISDENELRISFSNKDSYFQPKFNSEIKVILYITDGAAGKFDVYNGTDISIITDNTTYPYNSNLPLIAMPMSASAGGKDARGIEELQALTVEGFRTANAYTTDNDLESYFENYEYRFGNKCKFIKARDDVVDRLFTGFLIMAKDDYIYPTNTLAVDLNLNQIDNTDPGKYILDPGHLFKYNGKQDHISLFNNQEKMEQYLQEYEEYKNNNDVPSKYSIYDYMNDMGYNTRMTVFDKGIDKYEGIGDFLYTNPFLIAITKSPNLVGLYLTIVNQRSIVDFTNQNQDIFDQFIMYQLHLYRPLTAEKTYTLSTIVAPSSSYTSDNPPIEYFGDKEKCSENKLRVVAVFCDQTGRELCFTELIPTEKDMSENYSFTGSISTDDHVTSTNKFRVTENVTYMDNLEDMLIPMTDAIVKIYTLYYYGYSTNNRFLEYDSSYAGYVWTNVYSTESDRLTFIKPLNMIRSTITFADDRLDTVNIGDVSLSAFPFVKYSIVQDEERFSYFIEQFTNQYINLEKVINALQTSTHIDLKFYNTYGKSKNFIIGDEGDDLIDTINISISYDLWITSGTDRIQAEKDLKLFIKEYIEKINDKGTNNFFNSNLIREIETNFAYVDHMKFNGINSYDSSIQTVKNNTIDLYTLTKEERRVYVPEILVVDMDNITLRFYDA